MTKKSPLARPKPKHEFRRLTQDELRAELEERFGPDPMEWAFVCPHCGDVATGGDFRRALDSRGQVGESVSARLGQICIGRVLGILDLPAREAHLWTGRGCDWTAFGLFRGPWIVQIPKEDHPDGMIEVGCFPIAPARIGAPQ